MTTICVPDREALPFLQVSGVDVLIWDGTGEPPSGIEGVEFFIAKYRGQPADAVVLARMSSLRVVQLLSAGVETWLPWVPEGVVLCNGRGVHGSSTAELAVAGMLSLLRGLPTFRECQREHCWRAMATSGLAGKSVLILGAGDIGSRIAAAVRPFDAETTLVARRERDGVRTIDDLPELLPRHEVVVIALPYNTHTERLVDATFLEALPNAALLVNIARGGIVDTSALLFELQAKRLFAFLDVTEPEPLPTDHPLWDAPNLLLTPHVGGGTDGWQGRAYELVREQLQRYLRGEPLHNVSTEM